MMRNDTRLELIDKAESILDEKIGLIEGSRIMRSFYLLVPEHERRLFDSIIGFESETDDYPLGDVRIKYHESVLSQLDAEMADYIERAKRPVFAAIRKVVDYYK